VTELWQGTSKTSNISASGSGGLLVTYKKITDSINDPTGWHVAHFANIRGKNEWEHVDHVVIAGRNQMRVEDAESLARCLYVDDDEPLNLAGHLVPEARGYRLREGEEGVYVDVHPDPRMQQIIELNRERESAQAIDRARLSHNKDPKVVYILSNVPLDITVDHLVTWEEAITGGSRLERALDALDGILPLNSQVLAEHFPDLWVSKDAAQKEIQRKFKTDKFLYIYSYRKMSVLNLVDYRYRRPGQRRWSRVLSAWDVAGTRERVESSIGPLAAFEVVEKQV
jgi:hypothetical protein